MSNSEKIIRAFMDEMGIRYYILESEECRFLIIPLEKQFVYETIRQSKEKKRKELREKYYWHEYEIRSRQSSSKVNK